MSPTELPLAARGVGHRARDAALEEQRDALLKSLRDLETERAAGDVAEADYQELRDDYTAQAAAVIRALDGGAPAPSSVALRGSGSKEARSQRRSMAVTLAIVAAIVGLAVGSVLVFAGGREAGQPLSGTLPGEADMGAKVDATAPADERLAQAVELDRQGRGVDALKVYDEILRTEPDNAPALAYRGWLLKRAGLIDEAMVALDRAVTVAPTFADAHFFRGMALLEGRNDPAGAVAEFETFLRNDPPPEMVPSVVRVLDRARAAVAAEEGEEPATP